MVLAPAAVDVHHERRLRPVPEAAPRARRAGQRLDPRRARHDGRLLRTRSPTATSASCASSSRSCSSARRASTGRRNCAVAASFLHRDDCARRDRIGVDHIMWGSDYPHLEGTFPFSREAMQMTFEGVPHDEVAAMLGGNAAADLRLRPRRARAARRGVRSVGERRRRRPRPRARGRAQHGVLQDRGVERLSYGRRLRPGGMFWLWRNRLSGSHSSLSACRRGVLLGPERRLDPARALVADEVEVDAAGRPRLHRRRDARACTRCCVSSSAGSAHIDRKWMLNGAVPLRRTRSRPRRRGRSRRRRGRG